MAGAGALLRTTTPELTDIDNYANILGNIFHQKYQEIKGNKEIITPLDIVGNGMNIFWTDLTQLMIQNPSFLGEVIDQFLVQLDQPLSRLFNWELVENAREKHTIFVRIHLDEYAANPGVRKTISRVHGMWQEVSTTEVRNAGKDITMDWYFLNKAGAAGLKELALKIKQVNSDINSAILQHVATQIMRSELFFKDRNQMPWRISGIQTVAQAMLERIAKVGGINKRQTGFYESFERANAALSHRNGPGAKELIASNNTLFNIVHRNPKMATYAARGEKGVTDRFSYVIESTFQGLRLNAFPQTQKNLHNPFDKSNYVHERTFGSRFMFPDYSRDLQNPRDYRSWMRRVDVVGSDNNDWNGFTLPDVIEKTEFFFNKKDDREYGLLDYKVLDQYIEMYQKNQHDRDSLWEERKIERNTHNLRLTYPWLLYNNKGKHVYATRFGDISQLQVEESEWDIMYQIFAQRLFHEGHFTQNELTFFIEYLQENSQTTPLDILNDAVLSVSGLFIRLWKRLKELTVLEHFHDKKIKRDPNNYVEKESKYKNQANYVHRNEEALKNDDPLVAFAGCIFLNSLICLQTFEKMWENNVLFPFTATLNRPLERHTTEHLLYTNGLSLGEAAWDGIKSTNMFDAPYKQFHSSFKTDFSATVVNYQNLYMDDAVRITGTINGKNSGVFDMRNTTSKHESNVYKRIAEHESWLPFIGCYKECVGKAFENGQPVTVSMTGMHDPAVWMQELPASSPSFQTTYPRRQFAGQDSLFFKNIFKPKPHNILQTTSLVELLNFKNETLYCNETTIRHFSPKYNAWIIRPGCHELGLQLPNVRRVDAGLVTLDVIKSRDDYYRTHKIAKYS